VSWSWSQPKLWPSCSTFSGRQFSPSGSGHFPEPDMFECHTCKNDKLPLWSHTPFFVVLLLEGPLTSCAVVNPSQQPFMMAEKAESSKSCPLPSFQYAMPQTAGKVQQQQQQPVKKGFCISAGNERGWQWPADQGPIYCQDVLVNAVAGCAACVPHQTCWVQLDRRWHAALYAFTLCPVGKHIS